MDIRKVLFSGLVASAAVALPATAAGAAVVNGAPPAPQLSNLGGYNPGHGPNCTPPKPPKRHHHGDQGGLGHQAGFGNNGSQGNGWKNQGPPPPGRKPGKTCTCRPGYQAPPPFYSIFEPLSLAVLYTLDTSSYTCPPGRGMRP